MKLTPPYYAVIFTSQHVNRADPEYDAAGNEMAALAATMPGYLGIESAQNPDGFGITVSYWQDEAAAKAWRANVEHAAVRARGRDSWYASWHLYVTRIERDYGSA